MLAAIGSFIVGGLVGFFIGTCMRARGSSDAMAALGRELKARERQGERLHALAVVNAETIHEQGIEIDALRRQLETPGMAVVDGGEVA